jgi:hypothetical protein
MDSLTSMSSVDSFEKQVQNGQFCYKRNTRLGEGTPANYIVN